MLCNHMKLEQQVKEEVFSTFEAVFSTNIQNMNA